ncbi:MAG: TetR/AcrR family transcriptional regulator [Chloroflexota bacterium]|nr:TetR/AcrR family transcriptional regulator [Chloroflexota bacterium]MYD08412.1 TetR/AcrR family transcriptional regulator [Chloroflexota bacterium]
MKRMNPRAALSRRKLGDAVVSLLLEHDYKTPSVTAVRKRADVGHATFYRHYSSLDELLEDAMLSTMRDLAQLLREQETLYDETVALFRFIRDHQDRFRVYAGLPEAHPIRDVLKAEAIKIVVDRWEARRASPVPMDVSVNHLVESSYVFIRWHLNHIDDYTPEEAADFYKELILAGPEFNALSWRKDKLGQHATVETEE